MAKRFVLYPIQYNEQWKLYKAAEANFWTAEQFYLPPNDPQTTVNITAHTLAALRTCIADIIIGHDGGMLHQLCTDIGNPEARTFLGYQAMMRNIHTETYLNMLGYLSESSQQAEADILSARNRNTYLTWKTDVFNTTTDSLTARVVVFLCSENLFSSIFPAILSSPVMAGLPEVMLDATRKMAIDKEHTSDFLVDLLVRHSSPDYSEDRIKQILHTALNLEISLVSTTTVLKTQDERNHALHHANQAARRIHDILESTQTKILAENKGTDVSDHNEQLASSSRWSTDELF